MKKVFKGPVMAMLVGVVLGGSLIVLASQGQRADDGGGSTEEKIALAECLTDRGATFFGAFWCPHCANQKAAFGKEATAEIDYVECSNPDRSMTPSCQSAGIESYPTWEFADGSRVTGEQHLLTLAERAGCPYGDYTPDAGPAVPDGGEEADMSNQQNETADAPEEAVE